LPPTALREFVGPTALQTLLSMQVGAVTPPLKSPFGLQILQLLEKEPERSPDFEEIREQVEALYARRAADAALRESLDRLRNEAEISLAPDAPR
jgi:parvulin-like peptidyl-prolyl isomerase